MSNLKHYNNIDNETFVLHSACSQLKRKILRKKVSLAQFVKLRSRELVWGSLADRIHTGQHSGHWVQMYTRVSYQNILFLSASVAITALGVDFGGAFYIFLSNEGSLVPYN